MQSVRIKACMRKTVAVVARRYVHEATQSLPVIGDADTGYGNAVNVKRTLRGFAAAGFAGILIEDQVCWRARCMQHSVLDTQP